MGEKYISGKIAWRWVVETWPMDISATLLLLGVIFLFYLRRQQSSQIKAYVDIVVVFALQIVTFYWFWLIIRGLCFSKEDEKHYSFDPIKMAFVFGCFVILFRMAVGGRELEGIEIGPAVPLKNVARQKKNPNTQTAIKSNHTTVTVKALSGRSTNMRAYITIKKIKTEPINFYEILALLIFAGLFYYRKDLKEGDQANGLDLLMGWLGRAWAYKISNGSVGGVPENISTTNETSKAPMAANEEIAVTGPPSRFKKEETTSTANLLPNDPFLK